MAKEVIINPYMMFIGSFLPNWLLERDELNSTDKIVYARLCQFAGKNGSCFPRQDTLAEKIGMSENSVKKSLNKLIDNKLIISNRRGQGQSNLYKFLHHEWMDEGLNPHDSKDNPDRHYSSSLDRHHSSSLDGHHSGCVKENQIRESIKRIQKNPDTSPLRSNVDAKASPKIKEVPKDSKLDMSKPCNKYNYTYVGNMKDSSTYIDKLNQTKRSYIAMLERDYGKVMHKTYSDNLVNGKKEKFFIALTTFLLEWDKQTPNRVKTYRDLVKCYYRRVFFNANEESAHSFYREKIPNPNQLITENAIDVWHQFWDRNPMLVIKPKEVSKAVKIQQAKEIEKFGRHFEDLCAHLFDNSYELATGGQEKRNEFFDLKELKVKMREFRKESGAV